MACNYGLLSMNYGLLWGIVAYYFGLLGFPGSLRKLSDTMPKPKLHQTTWQIPLQVSLAPPREDQASSHHQHPEPRGGRPALGL